MARSLFSALLIACIVQTSSAIYADQKNKYDSTYPSLSPSPPQTLQFLDKSSFLVTSPLGISALNIDTGARLWSHPLPSPKIEVTSSNVKLSSDGNIYTVDFLGRLSASSSKPKPTTPPTITDTAPKSIPNVFLPPSAIVSLRAESNGIIIECLNVNVCYAFEGSNHLWTSYDFLSSEIEDTKIQGEVVKTISKVDSQYYEYSLDTSTKSVAVKSLDYVTSEVSKIKFNPNCGILAHDDKFAYCNGQSTEFEKPILACYTNAVCAYESEIEGRISQINLLTGSAIGSEIIHVTSSTGVKTYINNTLTSSYNLSPSEKLIDYYHANPEEKISSNVHVTGEDGLLIKHSKNYIAIASEVVESIDVFSVETTAKKPKGVEPVQPTTTTKSKPTLSITLYDVTSGKVLHRQTHTTSKLLHLVITDNWTIYLLYNPTTKRTEISVICLYAGLIPKDGIGLTHSKGVPKNTGEGVFDRENPIALQRVYTVPKPVSGFEVGLSRFGIVPKSVFLTLKNGGIWSIDLRMLDPRRPTGDPNLGEKKEGLTKYDPVLPFIPTMVASTDRAVSLNKITTSPQTLESTINIFSSGESGGYFVRYKGRQRFDELPEEFNKTALIGGVVALGAIWLVGRGYARKKGVNIAWQ